MASVRRRAVISVAIATAVVLLPMAYSTWHGYTTWWFRSSGSVRVDGHTNGYLHRNRDRSAIMLTRTDGTRKQSYLVRTHGRGVIIHCGEWAAPQFPAFPIGDVNPPCSIFSSGDTDKGYDVAIGSTLSVTGNHVAFSTESGRRIEAHW